MGGGGGGGGATRRHDAITYAWVSMLRSVGYRCAVEPVEQFEDKTRPDISVYNFRDGKKLLLDVSVAHPLRSSYVAQSATTASRDLLPLFKHSLKSFFNSY